MFLKCFLFYSSVTILFSQVLDFSQPSGAIGSDSVITGSNISPGNHESRIFIDSGTDKESSEKDKESLENYNESPDSDKESPNNKETDGILSEFLTNDGIKGLSRYLKVGLVARIKRWKSLQEMGMFDLLDFCLPFIT